MQALIDYALKSRRTVLLLFSFLIIAGWITYTSIPKESAPDIKIPIIVTTVNHHGIAPRDGEKLIIRPLEEEFRTLEGVKEMQSLAHEGSGKVILHFHAGYNLTRALSDVRQRVNMAKAKLPVDTKEPEIKEMNVSLFPVLVVHLSGNVPDRTLLKASQDLQDHIETNKSVLEASISGGRDEVVYFLLDPLRLESYGLSLEEMLMLFKKNHLLVSTGSLKAGSGDFAVKVPGLIKSVEEIQEMPLKVDSKNHVVVRFKDVATILPSYEDRKSYAYNWGLPSISLEVSKRTGENIINTIEQIRTSTQAFINNLSSSIKVTFTQDDSKRILDMLKDLQNNVILAVLLVMLIVVRSLGGRSALIVGAAIPTSFLAGILIIGLLGHTLNMVVLFALILSVGMLVDGAIIVVEYADRRMLEGASPADAYRDAAIRMRWPVFTSTITVLLVFLPLLFWPGVIGQFMKYLPITLLATLTASLFVALIFVPTLGGIFGRPPKVSQKGGKDVLTSDTGKLDTLKGSAGFYVRTLKRLLNAPMRVLWSVLLLLIVVVMIYGRFGRGVEFFPEVEPDSAAYVIHARGNLSLEEQDRLVRLVEKDLLDEPYFESISSKSKGAAGSDIIGRITVELVNWQERPRAETIFKDTLQKVRRHPGILVEVQKKKKGPSSGKSIQILVTSQDYADLAPEVQRVRSYLETIDGLENIDDSRPIPGLFEWEVLVDRAEAAKFGLSVAQIGHALSILTDGIKIGTYRPNHSRNEIELRARFSKQHRTLTQLEHVRIESAHGSIPLSYVAKWAPVQKVDMIERTDGHLSMLLESNVSVGHLANTKIQEIQNWLKEHPPKNSVGVTFKGEEEDKAETKTFLARAFFVSIFLIVIVLVTQFNSFFSTLLVISAIGLSTIGVLIGLLAMSLPFSIVMSGIGVIALAGIIVSNNIIFIDTFDQLKEKERTIREAILRTGAQRLRPIILTQVTTILGLLPILFQVNMDFVGREFSIGAPSSEWWVQLANAIAFGVFFASILTLIVTPCALMARENWRQWVQKKS